LQATEIPIFRGKAVIIDGAVLIDKAMFRKSISRIVKIADVNMVTLFFARGEAQGRDYKEEEDIGVFIHCRKEIENK